MTHRARGGNGCRLGSRRGIDGDMGWRRWWIEQLVNIDRVVLCTWFFVCGSVIRKKRIITITLFLNNDGLSFNHLFGVGGVQRNSKNGGRRVNRRHLSLSKSKIQDNGSNNVLKWCGMAKNIEDGFSLLLMMNKILLNSFEIMREE